MTQLDKIRLPCDTEDFFGRSRKTPPKQKRVIYPKKPSSRGHQTQGIFRSHLSLAEERTRQV